MFEGLSFSARSCGGSVKMAYFRGKRESREEEERDREKGKREVEEYR